MARAMSRVGRIATAVTVLLAVNCSCVYAQYTVFLDSFDDGNWTTNPRWEYAKSGPVTVSSERSTSGPYSLKVASNNEVGAIRAFSGLSSTSQDYTCTFNLYVESLGDEAIPWCLQSTGGSTVAIIFIFPGGTVQLFVVDALDKWSGKTANVPYPLTYGEWHSFRLTYNGSTTNLYLDGHAAPDASVTQAYLRIPARICVGNFSLPHTSTFYLDDLRITTPVQPNPAPVYVQICSDTSTSGISTSSHYMTFPALDNSYTAPDGQAAQVMAESFRMSHRDSLGNPVKFTWYMLVGSLYAYGTNTGPLLPLELMMDYHGDSIERWGDELAYHYHTWIWSDFNGDGIFYWNQAPDFTYCVEDFEQTVARMILDRAFYPSSFRSGWHYMDNFFQCYLDDWFPYRFENDYPNVRTETTEPIDNVYDWSRAPSAWAPYHPDPNDYQSPGNLRGWESRSRYMKSLSKSQAEDAFVQALGGASQLLTLFSHLKEADFPAQVSDVHAMLTEIHDSLPLVDFEYLTGRECMLKWRNGSDTIPPSIQVSTSDADGIRTAVIAANETIYQIQPFAAWAGRDGTYSRLDCTPLDANRWQIQYPLADTLKIAVGVTDWFGNPKVQFLPAPLRISNVKSAVTSASAEIRWETSNPADTRLEYRLATSGAKISLHEAERALVHRVTLTNLLPGHVYEIKLFAQDEFGQNAESDDIYILTKLSEPMIIDNLDPGFSTVGSWSTGTVAAGRYGPDYRYAGTSPSGASAAYWTWQVTETGVYRICAWWSDGGNRSAEAKYAVLHQGNEYPKTVNQQTDGGKWNTLGTYELTAGDTVSVRLSNAAPSGYVVIADAVKFEQAYVPIPSVGLARRLPDGNDVRISNAAVTAVFGPEFYVEELDRSAGLKVVGSGVEVGDLVEVCGRLSTDNGERVIADSTVRKLGGPAHLKPLGLAGRDVDLNGTRGLSAAGLLVTVWGKVTAAGSDYFYIDDGSALQDGSGNIGLRIDASSLSSIPDTTRYAVVTGILASTVLDSRIIPLIRPRSDEDVLSYQVTPL